MTTTTSTMREIKPGAFVWINQHVYKWPAPFVDDTRMEFICVALPGKEGWFELKSPRFGLDPDIYGPLFIQEKDLG